MYKLLMKTWNNMQTPRFGIYSVMLVVTGILLASAFYPEDTKASILGGIDEPTGSAYDDLYLAEEENAIITSGLNQTANENNKDPKVAMSALRKY
jgi:hypothetical protein